MCRGLKIGKRSTGKVTIGNDGVEGLAFPHEAEGFQAICGFQNGKVPSAQGKRERLAGTLVILNHQDNARFGGGGEHATVSWSWCVGG